MSILETEIKPIKTFYIVMEDDSNDVLDDDGNLSGGYSYQNWSELGDLVLDYLYDCKMFDTKEEAEVIAKQLEAKYESAFTVLKIVKSQAILYTLEH